jgi:hypothetical protein
MSNPYLEQLKEDQRRMALERENRVNQRLNELRMEQQRMSQSTMPPMEQIQQGGRDMMSMAGNYPESLYNYGKTALEGLASVVRDPVGAAKGVVALGEAALEKGGRKFEEFVTGEEIPPTRPEVEAPLDKIAEYYDEEYGSWDRARQSFIEDPVGSTADVFPFLGARFGPSAALRGGAGNVAGGASDRLYRRAAGIRKSDPSGLDKARGGARENIPVSEAGLAKARQMRGTIGQRIDNLIADRMLGDDLGLVSKTALNRHMNELIDEYRGTYDATTDVPFLQKEKVRLMQIFGDRQQIGLDELQDYKTKTYRKAYESESVGPKPEVENIAAKTEAQRTTARGAKEVLEERVPGYSEANRAFETFAQIIPNIREVIDRAPPGGYIDRTIRATLDNPKMQSRIAIGLRKAADGDFGWLEANLNTPEIRTVLYLTGQHQEESNPEAIPVWGGKQ